MSEVPSKVRALIESVRSKLTSSSKTPSGRPADQQRRGYQLYAKEAQVMGETPKSYDEWIQSEASNVGP